VYPDAPNVIRVAETVVRLLKSAIQLTGGASVRHWALDLGEAWGILRDEILNPQRRLEGVTWRCLMIDPESPDIQRLSSESVSVRIAAERIQQVQVFLGRNAAVMKERNIRFECRVSPVPPLMHGFLIEHTALLWSMCDIVDGVLDGADTPYWRFEAADDSAPASRPARAFANWFDYRWNTARQIGPS
jgi:hypothetical protein